MFLAVDYRKGSVGLMFGSDSIEIERDDKQALVELKKLVAMMEAGE